MRLYIKTNTSHTVMRWASWSWQLKRVYIISIILLLWLNQVTIAHTLGHLNCRGMIRKSTRKSLQLPDLFLTSWIICERGLYGNHPTLLACQSFCFTKIRLAKAAYEIGRIDNYIQTKTTRCNYTSMAWLQRWLSDCWSKALVRKCSTTSNHLYIP